MAHNFLAAMSPSVDLRRGLSLLLALIIFAFLLPVLWVTRLQPKAPPKDEAELLEELEAMAPKAPKPKGKIKPQQTRRPAGKPRRGPAQGRGPAASPADRRPCASGSEDGLSAMEAPAEEHPLQARGWLRADATGASWTEEPSTRKPSTPLDPLGQALAEGAISIEDWRAITACEAEDEELRNDWSQVGSVPGRRGAGRRAAKAAKAAMGEPPMVPAAPETLGGASHQEAGPELPLPSPCKAPPRPEPSDAAGHEASPGPVACAVDIAGEYDACSVAKLDAEASEPGSPIREVRMEVADSPLCTPLDLPPLQTCEEEALPLEALCVLEAPAVDANAPAGTLLPPPGLELMAPPPGLLPPPGLDAGALLPPPGLGWDFPHSPSPP